MFVRSPVLLSHGDGSAWSLLDAMPMATLVFTVDGQLVFANDHAVQVLGYAHETMSALHADQLLPGISTAWIQEAVQHIRWIDLEVARADGSRFAVEVHHGPLVLDGAQYLLVALRDVSVRVAADAQHRVLRTLDASDDAIFIFDSATLVFLFVNDGATRLTGWNRTELLVMTPLDLSPEVSEEDERGILQRLIGNEESSAASLVTMIRKDDSRVTVETTFQMARSPNDATIWIIMLARDITARLKRDNELAASQRALMLAEAELDTKAAVADDRERIARDLHDTVIQRLFGEGLGLQATLALVDARAAKRIQTTIEGLDQVIKDLRMAVFSLQGALAAPGGFRGRLVAAVSDSTEALGFEPRLQFDGPIETTPAHIADEIIHVLREALSNIAHHAMAHTARVAVESADEVVLTVSDDGIGVPADVFGGRGLANMRGRATRLGGECLITTQPTGHGAVLTWRVPAERRVRERRRS